MSHDFVKFTISLLFLNGYFLIYFVTFGGESIWFDRTVFKLCNMLRFVERIKNMVHQK